MKLNRFLIAQLYNKKISLDESSIGIKKEKSL
jgi:hypothetical protein